MSQAELSAVIRRQLTARGLSERELAKEIGISHSLVHKLAAGHPGNLYDKTARALRLWASRLPAVASAP